MKRWIACAMACLCCLYASGCAVGILQGERGGNLQMVQLKSESYYPANKTFLLTVDSFISEFNAHVENGLLCVEEVEKDEKAAPYLIESKAVLSDGVEFTITYREYNGLIYGAKIIGTPGETYEAYCCTLASMMDGNAIEEAEKLVAGLTEYNQVRDEGGVRYRKGKYSAEENTDIFETISLYCPGQAGAAAQPMVWDADDESFNLTISQFIARYNEVNNDYHQIPITGVQIEPPLYAGIKDYDEDNIFNEHITLDIGNFDDVEITIYFKAATQRVVGAEAKTTKIDSTGEYIELRIASAFLMACLQGQDFESASDMAVRMSFTDGTLIDDGGMGLGVDVYEKDYTINGVEAKCLLTTSRIPMVIFKLGSIKTI